MALIIFGKTKCKLCGLVMKDGDKIAGFPAFLPYDHKYGKFSDASMHESCYLADPGCNTVDNLLAAYNLIWDTCPKGKKSIEEYEAWSKDAFQDWPPKDDVVVFESEDGGFYMDAKDYKDLCEAENAHEKERKELREYYRRLEHEAWLYSRDD